MNLPRTLFDTDSTLINQLLADQIARYVFGPDAEYQRLLGRDRDVTTALGILDHARTQQDLLRAATKR
jgi:hypothetical protein